jgi:LDH2 family malate/lactate/ureidoglycolate dehydrogenase
MNTQPISHARDADLRLSQVAMERAAVRARKLAAQTGTALIVSRNGVIERIQPEVTEAGRVLQ